MGISGEKAITHALESGSGHQVVHQSAQGTIAVKAPLRLQELGRSYVPKVTAAKLYGMTSRGPTERISQKILVEDPMLRNTVVRSDGNRSQIADDQRGVGCRNPAQGELL